MPLASPFFWAALVFLASALDARAQSLDDFAVVPVDVATPSLTSTGKTDERAYTFRSASAYNGVMIRGYSDAQDVTGFIRFDGEAEWHPLSFLRGPRDVVFLAGYRSAVYRSGAGFVIRIASPAGTPVELLEAGTFDNRLDADRNPSDDRPAVEAGVAGQIVPPTLINRAAWGARPFIGTPEPLARPSYTRMSFHHAACCSAYTYEEGLAQLRSIQIFHQDVRGWSDIGYQFLMDQEGRVYQGRPFLDNRPNLDRPPQLAMGAHVGNANTGNIGVSVLGCYHPAEGPECEDMLSPAAYDSLITIFAYLSENYRVTTPNLLGHRDQGSTSCPGDNNYALLPGMRTDIDRLIAQGNAPIAFASLSASSDADGVVRLSGSFSEIIDVESFWIERDAGGQVTRIFSRSEATDFSASDPAVPEAGVVSYALYARSSTGREQRLSEQTVTVSAPAGYALHQAFPNPTPGEAVVRYYLAREGIVRLALYTTSGQQVRQLVDAFQEGERWYALPLSTAGLASGTYLYRITVEGFSGVDFDATRTLTVVR
ncbi:MAG: N-acetylmuramoyl-L-alanine amidase [Rhodothermales bacterium]